MFSPVMIAGLEGFLLGAGLIIAIGAQNAFILKQGLKKQYVFALCSFCFLSDALLIIAGVAGMGQLVSSSPLFTQIAAIGGGLFLFWFGLNSFKAAFKDQSLQAEKNNAPTSLLKAVSLVAALTWLNPHVYLDTVVMLGSIAGQYPTEERLYFAVGAVVASMVWFYGLGYGAAKLAPIFAKPRAWQILDILIGLVMWFIAANLLMTLL